jgi:uncharacterized protein (DUF885 family)
MESFLAPAFYITAPIDDYDEHSIFINSSTDASSLTYFTTLAHEGFPGHLYQTVMSYQSNPSSVRAILNFPGYVEGWATYAEMQSYFYAGLDDALAEYLAANQSALLSLYASTDIGIHSDGWTFADMTAFWAEYGFTSSDASQAAVLREIYDLIVQEPTHYLKYYVGYLHFLDLKEAAKETYGDAFNEVAFHDAILAIGPAPFSIVADYLDSYYKSSLSTSR